MSDIRKCEGFEYVGLGESDEKTGANYSSSKKKSCSVFQCQVNRFSFQAIDKRFLAFHNHFGVEINEISQSAKKFFRVHDAT